MANIAGGSVIWNLDVDNSRFNSKLKGASSQVSDTAQKTSKRWSDAWTTGTAVATSAVLAGTALMIKGFISSASEIQSLRASFSSLTGNVEDTNKVMTSLYELGKQTAFSNLDIQAAGRGFLAAGIEVDKLQEILQHTADVAGATGADLGQLTLPLTQTIARGKLQTQDFYQIMNAGAGALRKPLTELAGKKGFGTLAEAMEKGGLTSDDLLKTLKKVSSEGGFAFEGAIKQSKTFNGRMSNLKEAVTNFGLSLLGVNAITGEIDPSGPFAKLSNAVSMATTFLTEHGTVIKQILTVITILLIPAFIRLGVQALLAGARMLAGMLLALGPIGLIIAAVGAIAYLIIKNWTTVKTWLSNFWKWLKDIFSKGLQWIKQNWLKILVFLTGPIGLAVELVIKNFDKIKQAISTVLSWIKTGFSKIAGIGTSIIKGAVNAVLGFAERTINGFIELVNKAIRAINKLPGVNIGEIGKIDIPKLAKGGIVPATSGGRLAVIGEGGEDEAVIPLSKLKDMNIGGGSGDVKIEVNMSGIMARSRADLRDIGVDIVESINEGLRAKGLPEIGGGKILGVASNG